VESTEQSRTCTDAARVTTLAPRPAPPKQRLTARPVTHDLFDRGGYDASFDRFQHHADKAFGEPVGGAA
jgi:hypothetical protein